MARALAMKSFTRLIFTGEIVWENPQEGKDGYGLGVSLCWLAHGSARSGAVNRNRAVGRAESGCSSIQHPNPVTRRESSARTWSSIWIECIHAYTHNTGMKRVCQVEFFTHFSQIFHDAQPGAHCDPQIENGGVSRSRNVRGQMSGVKR
jgi:hypothetical protein